MKDTIKAVIVLLLIAGLSGATLTALNQITEPIIAENLEKKSKSLYKELYPNFDEVDGTYTSEYVETEDIYVITLLDVDGTTEIGKIYQGTAVNSYGEITVLATIEAGNIGEVKYLKFNQTPGFAEKAKDHADTTYPGLATSDVASVDTKTGATYASNTIKEIMERFIAYEGGAA